ncbi:MAG: hypothetical protein JXR97_12910 [Planctomycetes bacterium]|nr:hypothetical protein [Planctomycetota bacterium]
MPEKWFCLCGQINPNFREKCVNCNMDKEEALLDAFDEEKHTNCAPPERLPDAISKTVKSLAINSSNGRVVGTEKSAAIWFVFPLLFALTAAVFFVILYFGFNDGRLRLELVFEWLVYFPLPFLILLFGAATLASTPNIQLVLDSEMGEVVLKKRWWIIPYCVRSWPLEHYKITRGHKKITIEEADGYNVGKSLLAAAVSFGVIIGVQNTVRYDERISAIALTTGAGGEIFNLVACSNGNDIEDFLQQASSLVPDRVDLPPM